MKPQWQLIDEVNNVRIIKFTKLSELKGHHLQLELIEESHEHQVSSFVKLEIEDKVSFLAVNAGGGLSENSDVKLEEGSLQIVFDLIVVKVKHVVFDL